MEGFEDESLPGAGQPDLLEALHPDDAERLRSLTGFPHLKVAI